MKQPKKALYSRLCVLALALCLSVGVIAMSASAESPASAADPSPAAYVAEKNANSVVGILTYTEEWLRSSGQIQSVNTSQGSGVVIREGGYVLTNNHVIEDGSSYQVLMPSGEKVDAELVGADPAMDLAVLRVDEAYADQLTPVDIGSSSDLPVGSTVVAIGNPGGETLANSVTQGIVSALERSNVSEYAGNTTRSVSYIQHDAAINSGNSGGGLFNYRGELVGINTLKYSGSAYSGITFEGLSFAIPSETAERIASDLIEYGKVIRPALGVQVAAYDGPDEPMSNRGPASLCIYVVNEGGAAEAAGLQQYDFIYAVNGVRVTSTTELTAQLDQYQPGDTIEVTVIRYKNASQNTYSGNAFYSFGRVPGNSDAQEDDSSRTQAGELTVSGGYEEITVELTLEELE